VPAIHRRNHRSLAISTGVLQHNRPNADSHGEVVQRLLLLKRGRTDYIRSDNGPEFAAAPFQDWLQRVGIQPIRIYPGSPWENGYIESFNSKLRDELLNGEIFSTLREAQILIADWRRLYNGLRPHSSLGYRPPAPETIKPLPIQTTALEPIRVALH